MACCSRITALYILISVGLLFTIGFAVMVAVWPTLYFNVLKGRLILTENSMSYDLWKESPFPMYLELFLYNFTNSDEVFKNNSVKPNFEEKGPYVFRERHVKINTTWNTNGTVSFYRRRIWNFEPEMTSGDLSDRITNMNMIAVSASYIVRHRTMFERRILDQSLKIYGEGMVVTKTVGELLFEGYEDRLLNIMANISIPGMDLPYDKFGWFYARNLSDTFDGLFTMHTGANDIGMLGAMDKWNNKDHVDYYDGQCGVVRGSAGELFPPRTDPESVTLFAPDICSYMTLVRNGSKMMKGMDGALFRGDDSPFSNGQNHPEQACFCRGGDVCSPPGTRNVSQCRFGAPAFISYPHFHLTDPVYLEKLDGITPAHQDKDAFEIILELGTGVPLFVKAQLQINVLVQRIPGITYFDKMPDNIYIPMLWFRQEVTISDDLAKQAKLGISVDEIFPPVFYTLTALGALLVIVAVAYFIKLRKSETSDPKNTL